MNATTKVERRIKAVAMLRKAIAKGLDVAAFAGQIDKKPEAIGRWLADQNLPPPDTADLIISILSK